MQLKYRQTQVPPESFYSNDYRSDTGVKYYSDPGTLVTAIGYNDSEETLRTTSGKRSKFHPCFHYRKQRTVLNPYILGSNYDYSANRNDSNQVHWIVHPIYALGFWRASRYGTMNCAGSGTAEFGDWMEPPLKLVPSLVQTHTDGYPIQLEPDDVVSELVPLSIRSMAPHVKAESQGLVEDLIQIKQVSTLLDTMHRVKFALKMVRSRALSSKLTLRSVAAAVSDVYLQWSFNIAPIISDVLGVIQAVRDIERKLHWLSSNEGKVLTSHFRRYLNDDYVDVPPTYTSFTTPVAFCNPTCQSRVQVLYPVRVFSATLQYRFTTDLLGGPGDRLRLFLDQIGVNLNPSIVWNLIPWTFILDWFVNVSSWLDQFKTTELGIQTQLLQYCYSVHVKRESHLATGETGLQDVCSVFEDMYYRKVIDPLKHQTIPIETGGLTAIEASLLAALGFAKFS